MDSTERIGGASETVIAVEGRNCWRRVHADRIAFIVDGEEYFRAIAEAIARAERTIYLIGWDVHGRVDLAPDGWRPDLPSELGALLNAVLKRRRRLRAYVLDWDFAMLYVWGRELLPLFRFHWRTHRRLAFRFADDHAIGGCHHQKIVVIDDRLAFVGGLDLTIERWDTRAHAADDPRRVTPAGKPYCGFHDAMMAVDGDAARAFGELARQRWRSATQRKLSAPRGVIGDPWPTNLPIHTRDTEVAIACTLPKISDRTIDTREVEELYIDQIRAAKQVIYIENQYFTAARVGQALTDRLQEEHGPEIIVVTRFECTGWLEEVVMGGLRARLLRQMRAADQHGRFHVYYPSSGGDRKSAIVVHAKIIIVDDVSLRIGSANLNNRSMGLDTECDAEIEAGNDPERRSAIRSFRDGLIAEHLGITADEVSRAVETCGTVATAIELLRRANGEKRLTPLEVEAAWSDGMLPNQSFIDPEKPVSVDEMIAGWVPEEDRTERTPPLLSALTTLLLVLAFAAAWRWTALGQFITPQTIGEWAGEIGRSPIGLLACTIVFTVASVLMVPLSVLIVLATFSLGFWDGIFCSLVGGMMSAAIGYRLGTMLRRDTVRRLSGPRLNPVSRRLTRGGVLAVMLLRILPVAPFAAVSLVAGSSRVPYPDFLLGTLCGLPPVAFLVTATATQVVEAIRNPTDGRLWSATLVVLVLMIITFGLDRRARRGGL